MGRNISATFSKNDATPGSGPTYCHKSRPPLAIFRASRNLLLFKVMSFGAFSQNWVQKISSSSALLTPSHTLSSVSYFAALHTASQVLLRSPIRSPDSSIGLATSQHSAPLLTYSRAVPSALHSPIRPALFQLSATSQHSTPLLIYFRALTSVLRSPIRPALSHQSRHTMPGLKTRIQRVRQHKHKLHNERQKFNPAPKLHNPYCAEPVFFPKHSLGNLRLRYQSRSTKVITSAVRRQYHEGKFRRITHDPDKHTLIYGFDNAIIGYRIPADNLHYIQRLSEAVRALADGLDKRTTTYRGKYISHNYCAWAPYAKEPFLSAHFGEDGISAQKFMHDTQILWDKMAHHFEVLFPGPYKEALALPLPKGLSRLAGAFMGCAVNVQQDADSHVQTGIHCDVRERPFVPSCLCPIGDYQGGDLILWEL